MTLAPRERCLMFSLYWPLHLWGFGKNGKLFRDPLATFMIPCWKSGSNVKGAGVGFLQETPTLEACMLNRLASCCPTGEDTVKSSWSDKRRTPNLPACPPGEMGLGMEVGQ